MQPVSWLKVASDQLKKSDNRSRKEGKYSLFNNSQRLLTQVRLSLGSPSKPPPLPLPSNTRTCTCYHCKKTTDKPINKLANQTLSLLFWACPSIRLSVRCCGHSNLVIFNRIFSNFHIIIKLSFKFEYRFFSVKR